MYSTIFSLLLFTICFCHVSCTPEQVHLSYGDNVNEIVVTWSTFDEADSVVEYGIDGLDLKAVGSFDVFVDGGSKKSTQYIHRVKLPGLISSSKYVYRCGSDDKGWSKAFWFRTAPEESTWSPNLLIFGDLGLKNAQALPKLKEDVHSEIYDAIIHVGDIAYDMYENDGKVGDEYMKQTEVIAAYIPYIVTPGNHESAYNFSHYRARFSMPGGTENIMFSFNMGPVHFISISAEVYYFINYGVKPLVFQYQWLVNDLKEANLPENREKRPWIVLFSHRPMYCGNNNDDDCTYEKSILRGGIPFLHVFGVEKLLYDYGVDLAIWAHEHSYERLWPVYEHKVYNGSYDKPYTNPKAPVHVITGAAGNRGGQADFVTSPQEWSAFRNSDFGYSRFKAHNKTHLHWEQVSVEQSGNVFDSFWLIKDSHGPYTPLNDKTKLKKK